MKNIFKRLISSSLIIAMLLTISINNVYASDNSNDISMEFTEETKKELVDFVSENYSEYKEETIDMFFEENKDDIEYSDKKSKIQSRSLFNAPKEEKDEIYNINDKVRVVFPKDDSLFLLDVIEEGEEKEVQEVQNNIQSRAAKKVYEKNVTNTRYAYAYMLGQKIFSITATGLVRYDGGTACAASETIRGYTNTYYIAGLTWSNDGVKVSSYQRDSNQMGCILATTNFTFGFTYKGNGLKFKNRYASVEANLSANGYSYHNTSPISNNWY